MSTPVINAVDDVNDASLNTLFQAVSNTAEARQNLSQSDRNIDAVASNASAVRGLGDNGGQDEAIRLCLCRRTGRDPANFPDTRTDIIQNDTFRGEVFGDATLSALVSASKPGMEEIVSSATLSSEMAASQAAMQGVAASQTAMQEVVGSSTARQQVIASATAMQEIAASQTAMQEMVASETALQEIAASETAMQEIAASETAMQDIAASQTAIDFIASNDNESIAENTVLNSETATTELISSPLVTDLSVSFNSGLNAAQTITNSRVLVVSNNNSGNGFADVSIDYVNDVGPETQSGSTFIINSASTNNDPNNSSSGNAVVSGIIIN